MTDTQAKPAAGHEVVQAELISVAQEMASHGQLASHGQGESGPAASNTDSMDAASEEFLAQANHRGHLIYCVIALVVLGLTFVLKAPQGERVFVGGISEPLPELCYMKVSTGYPCPACGLTRSFISMSAGEWEKAFGFNWGGPILYFLMLTLIPWHAYQFFARRALSQPATIPWTPWILVGCAFLLTIQWVIRIFIIG